MFYQHNCIYAGDIITYILPADCDYLYRSFVWRFYVMWDMSERYRICIDRQRSLWYPTYNISAMDVKRDDVHIRRSQRMSWNIIWLSKIKHMLYPKYVDEVVFSVGYAIHAGCSNWSHQFDKLPMGIYKNLLVGLKFLKGICFLNWLTFIMVCVQTLLIFECSVSYTMFLKFWFWLHKRKKCKNSQFEKLRIELN